MAEVGTALSETLHRVTIGHAPCNVAGRPVLSSVRGESEIPLLRGPAICGASAIYSGRRKVDAAPCSRPPRWPVHVTDLAAEIAVIDDSVFRLMVEEIPHIVWMATPDGAMHYVNRQGRVYAGPPVGVVLRGLDHPGARRRRGKGNAGKGTREIGLALRIASSAGSDDSTASIGGTISVEFPSMATSASPRNGSGPPTISMTPRHWRANYGRAPRNPRGRWRCWRRCNPRPPSALDSWIGTTAG